MRSASSASLRSGLAIAALGVLGCGGADPGGMTGEAGRWGFAGTGGSRGGGRGGAGGSAVAGSGGQAGTTGGAGTGGAGAAPTCGKEDCGTDCTIPALPAFSALTANDKLPDPFMTIAGTRIASRSEWQCRRAEISAQIQNYEAGQKNPKDPGAVTATVSGKTLTVNVLGKSFTVSITLPRGDGPFPAIIGLDGMSIPVSGSLDSLGVAQINFDTNKMGNQSGSRGTGFFYDVNGDKSVGALMAWAWGVSRVIDALEVTPDAKIDPKRIGITGCSRNGKGALAVGAYDERFKLVIPQESGSGGSGNWRVSQWMLSQGQSTQTLSEITGENVWFRSNFSQFGNSVNKLPFDHHALEGLVAPRALLVIENNILWLGPQSSWSGANAARGVWQALAVTDRMGYSLTTEHGHCSFPSSQQAEVTAYVQKFLVGGGTANTNIMRNDPGVQYNASQWVNWTVPTLQ